MTSYLGLHHSQGSEHYDDQGLGESGWAEEAWGWLVNHQILKKKEIRLKEPV